MAVFCSEKINKNKIRWLMKLHISYTFSSAIYEVYNIRGITSRLGLFGYLI